MALEENLSENSAFDSQLEVQMLWAAVLVAQSERSGSVTSSILKYLTYIIAHTNSSSLYFAPNILLEAASFAGSFFDSYEQYYLP